MKTSLSFFFLIGILLSLGSVVHAAPSTASGGFSMHNFASCQDLKSTFADIVADMPTGYPVPIAYATPLAKTGLDTVIPASQETSSSVSTTNTQVVGVDEGDTARTDGKSIYTLNTTANTLEIVDAMTLTESSIIRFPSGTTPTSIYLSDGQLVVIATRWSESGDAFAPRRWYVPSSKTVISVYNMQDPKNPKLTHIHEIDGYYKDSRLVDGRLYFLTQTDFRIAPYFMPTLARSSMKSGSMSMRDTFLANFSLANIVPQIRDSVPNPKRPGKYLTNVRSGIGSCSDMSVVLPDRATIKSLNIIPTLTVIGSLDVRSSTAKVMSSIVFWDVSQIYMSQKNLYLASSLASTSNSCPPGALCKMSMYTGNSMTLIHRYAFARGKVNYANSTTLSGSPLNQYSMDEDASGNLRIVTTESRWSSQTSTSSTLLSVINPAGQIIGSLAGIAPWENFQASRFIGDRLYLVTFEQIDPFWVISLSNPRKPTILGELSIPGYSTYLHPYDANRLIGVGYDTIVNSHGGVQNSGIKIWLFNVADITHPKLESSLILGDAGSSSDALSDPHAFVWYSAKNLLLLPAMLMTNITSTSGSVLGQKAFQGIVGVSITPGSVVEKFRVSNIYLSGGMESAWKKDCAQYTTTTTPACTKLIDGSSYCPPSSVYVPQYCYAGATVDMYIASQIWNYSTQFIKRALYIGDTIYTLSDQSIRSWNLSNMATPVKSLDFVLPQDTGNPIIAY